MGYFTEKQHIYSIKTVKIAAKASWMKKLFVILYEFYTLYIYEQKETQMRNHNIKHTLWGIAALVGMSISTTACMDDDTTTETSPECVVTSFSAGKITSNVVEKEYDKDGNATDVIRTKSISGSDIHFNIDHVKGHIYTTDSLPSWVDLSKVTLSFVCYGSLYYKVPDEADLYYRLTSGSDSIDVSKTVDLLCVATDGVARKAYKLDIYKHKVATDTLVWKTLSSDLSIVGSSRLYNTNGKVMAFAHDGNGRNVCTATDETDGSTWSEPISIPVESSSVIMKGSTFYGTDAEGFIYTSADASTWSKASNRQVDRLLAADNNNVYALAGSSIIGSADMATWTEAGKADIDMLPDSYSSYAYYTSKTNDDICIAVMAGISSHNSHNGVTWYKQTSTLTDSDMPWAYIEVTADNTYGMPRLDNMSMTRYEGSLYVAGSIEEKYVRMYRSDDNGISWHQLSAKYPMPASLSTQQGKASVVAVGSQLWIIQENGNIWKGSIL